jgi:RNA polymerase sigma-70 factor (ECF subfamily)
VNTVAEKPSIPAKIQSDGKDDDTDRQLVARSQKGDADAFRQIFERYKRRAYALALGVVHDRDAALDVVQDAFLRAHRHLDGFEGNASVYTWLYRIVMNASIDHLRKRGRQKTVDYDDAVAHLEEESAADVAAMVPQLVRGNPAKELARREIREKIDEALGKLSPNHRAVLVMREVDGLSYEEMAKVMKCSKGTIMSRLFHARKNMQKLLIASLGPMEGSTGSQEDSQAEEEVEP